MAKISDLTTLTGAGVDTAADVLTIVDDSETGTARNKKITVAELLGLAAASDEEIDDRVAALLVAGTNVTLTYNDGAGTLTIDAASTSGGITDFNEAVDDRVAALIDAGAGISVSYDDVAGTLTISTTAATPASASDVWTGTSDAVVVTPNALFDAAAPTTLTDAATIAVDMATGINFNVTLGGNRTLGNPTNAKPGESGRIRVTQDGTGSRTLAYASNWKHIGSAPTIATAPGAVDLFAYFVNATDDIELSYLGTLA